MNIQTSFDQIISDPIIRAALKEQNLIHPTAVQAEAIPAALTGKDLIVQAQTGSGKTLAFVIPIVQRILENPSQRGTLALIVTPTRELALQVQEVIASIAPSIKPACIIGGASIRNQIRELRDDSRIVVGTPGRINDLLQQRELILRKCQTFVLDEADEMLSMGFLEEVRSILTKLPAQRQGMLFSATISPRVQMLSQSFLKEPQSIVIELNEINKPDIEHLFFRVSGGVTEKASALCNLIESQNPTSAVIFCNSKSDTELVEVYLRRRGFQASRINSDLSQKERQNIMQSMKNGELRLLIATDVAARGIDIESLDLVVNYSLHEDTEVYVHRTGRTGRAGRSGRAISIVGAQDFASFYRLQKRLPTVITEMSAPVANNNVIAKVG